MEEIKEGTKEKVPRNARQLWTDDQLAKLARLMNKYPGGTQDRWETIAEAMERYPWEITKMAANVKSSMHMVSLKTSFLMVSKKFPKNFQTQISFNPTYKAVYLILIEIVSDLCLDL